MTMTIGADPELFIRDSRTGSVVPIVGLIGGTKDHPIAMEGMADGFAMQEDNVMLEFNIPASATSRRFSRNIESALDYALNFIRIKSEHLEFDVGRCSRMFTTDQLSSKQARIFGCSADFGAYEQGQPLPTPNPDDLVDGDAAWRFSGGHVHLGYDSEVPDFVVASFADIYLGLPSVALDKQGIRRTLYGSAGRFRPTPWGIEYRTLSNYWIWDGGLRTTIGNNAFMLLRLVESKDKSALQRLYAEIPWTDVRAAINEEDFTKAADLITYLSNDLRMEGL